MQSKCEFTQLSKILLKNLIHCSSLLKELQDMVNIVNQMGIAFIEPPAFNIQLSGFSTHYHLNLKEMCNHFIGPDIFSGQTIETVNAHTVTCKKMQVEEAVPPYLRFPAST